MASRLVGLTGARRGAAIMSPISARGMTRGLHASRITRANEERAGEKQKSYFQPEIVPLYAIVILAISGGLYMGTRHLFHDNDLRRAPEHPAEGAKPQHRPEWKPVEGVKKPE